MKQDRALADWLTSVGASSAFEALADLLDEAAVFVVDAERSVVLWSPGAEALLGFGAEEIVGEHCLKANRCQQCISGCGIAEYGSIKNAPLTLFDDSGASVPVLKTARGFFAEDGSFAGGIEVLRPAPAEEATGRSWGTQSFHELTSADPAMHRVFQTCRNVAETDTSALVRGESGTGKELIARALHAESARRDSPFIAVNCAALTPSLMESELFGHVAGAFTGAVRDRVGIFEQADGGTLFLDEIAEFPLELQSKLLRVIEAREVLPVGAQTARPVDVRLISATHRSLREAVAAGDFREDLMYRLRVVPIFLPPLRERPADVPALLWRFIEERNRSGPRRVEHIAPDAMRALLHHRWPGNVRELRNVVEYAFAVGRGGTILIDELPPELAVASTPQHTATPTSEADTIRAALDDSDGHVGRAAARLGISRATLWRRRKRLGI